MLGISYGEVRDLCASGHLECKKDPGGSTWTVLVSPDRIQPSGYVAVGGFDGSVELDFALMEKIEEYGDEMMNWNLSPESMENVARIKGEICTILRAIQN